MLAANGWPFHFPVMAVAAEMPGPIQLQSPESQKEGGLEESNMVQVFMVVRCYSCKMFQVQQVKKTNKWVCKVCNEKQSVVKTYGKGTGKDCRRHVQKLNMLRAKKETEVKHTSTCVSEQHPPQDYASTFTTHDGDNDTLDVFEHPVVLGNTRTSRWTAFLSPNDEDEEETTSEHPTSSEVAPSSSKSRLITRRASDRIVSQRDSGELCPYSSVNYEATFQATPCSSDVGLSKPLTNSKSMYFHPDRYTKLEETCAPPVMQPPFSRGMPTSTKSMYNLTTSSANHKERMEKIKQDLQKFSTENDCKKSGIGRPGGSSIPKLSSRWTQFMCEEESNSEDEGRKENEDSHAISTHILASKSTIAKYTFGDVS